MVKPQLRRIDAAAPRPGGEWTRIWTRVENPGATVIEADRSDGWYRSVDGAQERPMVKSAHRVLRIFEYFAEINGQHR